MPDQKVPYWRLSSLYFFYFMAVGIILPFWGLYLESLNFSSAQIGVIVAIPMVTKLLAPNLWGWLADSTGHYLLVIQVGAVCTVVFFMGVLVRQDYVGLLISAAAFSFFWNAILPQFEVLTLDALGKNTHEYSRIRLWGSIGFIVSVVILGWYFERAGVQNLPQVMWGLLILIALSTFLLPKARVHHEHESSGNFLSVIKRHWVISFFAASMLLHVSHGVFYGFFSLHLFAYNYSKTVIGLLWAVGVVAEILIFIKVPCLFVRFNLWQCYLCGMLVSAFRWVLVAYFPQWWGVMLFTQVLHAFTFGITHAVAIEIVRRSFSRSDRGKAQAMYSALCFGAGGAAGAYSSGLIWDYGAQYSFLFAASTSFMGALIVFWGMGRYKKTNQ